MPHRPRPVEITGDTAIITLTQGKVAIVDASDAALVADRNWHYRAGRNSGYAAASGKVGEDLGACVYLHHMFLRPNPPFEVDHIDGDGLNNRRSNLRYATRQQNQANTGMWSHNTSGYKGVVWLPKQGYWIAQIRLSGKIKYLGSFDSADMASEAYKTASSKYFGEYSAGY